jgi:hypothetical protein
MRNKLLPYGFEFSNLLKFNVLLKINLTLIHQLIKKSVQ